jgi:hypothetical protein
MVIGHREHGVRSGEPLPDYAGWPPGCGVYIDTPGDLVAIRRRPVDRDQRAEV